MIGSTLGVLQVRRSLTRRVSPAPSDKTSSGRMSLGTSRRPSRRSSKRGQGIYWAYAQRRSDRGQSVSLGCWFLHVLRGRDGRALKHPRFYYFAVNTLLRNKAIRGKSYFVKKSYGDQAFEEHTPEALLRMGKAPLTRMLCAYEDKLPGSAANKLRQREDLEAMIEQLEMESVQCARARLPDTSRTLD